MHTNEVINLTKTTTQLVTLYVVLTNAEKQQSNHAHCAINSGNVQSRSFKVIDVNANR